MRLRKAQAKPTAAIVAVTATKNELQARHDVLGMLILVVLIIVVLLLTGRSGGG